MNIGNVMDSFVCLGCSQRAYVRSILCVDDKTYFKCEHCGAQHEVRVAQVPRGEPTRFEVLGVCAPHRS